ncbi:MAG: Ig-like domain-containing protein [Coprococcus sp.]|nr:Ig-like domain-containing protein [Coprococcus sp.]
MKTKQMKKRIMSMILALVIGICCIVPAAPAMKTEAASLKDVAKKVTLGEYNQIKLNGTKEKVLKIVLKSKGNFYLRSTENACLHGTLSMELYDSNLRMLGSITNYSMFTEISNEEFRQYDLKAGTYYVRIWNTYEYADPDPDELTGTYIATFEPCKEPSIDICISLKRKKSIQLGAIFNNCSKKKLIWKSSKKKVATVTSKGKVTAKKKGTAIITVFTPDGEQSRIKVIVK